MKVLFILQSIGYGGSMTSLINLMTLLKDNELIKIDILFMDPYGELLENAKAVASVCERNKLLEAITMSRKKICYLKKYDLLFLRVLYALAGKVIQKSTCELGYMKAAKKYDNQYDCVVAYQESIATSFARHIKAPKHVAWIHTSYNKLLQLFRDVEQLRSFYSSYDKIVCVSKACEKDFFSQSGIEAEKITHIYNPLLSDEITRKAEVPLSDIFTEECADKFKDCFHSGNLKLVSSGRFIPIKRFDRVVDAAAILRDRGYNFHWFIIGNGILFDEISGMVAGKKLEQYVHLTGGLTNPFPVVKNCDLFVLTSDSEAHPMVANEAMILGKPVISTDFESAREVVAHRVNGMICGMEVESIAETIMTLIDDKALYEKVKSGAACFKYDNDAIISQVIGIIS